MSDMIAAEFVAESAERFGRLPPPPTVESIQRAVARRERIAYAEMFSRRRSARIAMARQIAMWLVRQTTLHSFPAIGRMFGGRDHTTAMHAVSKIDQMMVDSPEFHAEMMALRLALTTGEPI